MSERLDIAIIVGSLRARSYNRCFAEFIRSRYASSYRAEFADIGVLPHYNQDNELDPGPEVAAFKRQIAVADGVVIVTPEFNWSIPGVLKNAIDWLSRVDKALIGKPVMVAGVSGGSRGTLRAQLQLRQILQSNGVNVKLLPPAGNEVLIGDAAQKFDETGALVDQELIAYMDGVMKRFQEWIRS
ncbi:NADPH-dependent FMN reductase [Cohnella candidum]|uniref:NAD(P)H-dependent oxidoreductase n=1 Tax=Cohnella candidum TaxID=2674991 RepID=A0A3G3JUN5_9BACL|nr:NADPH-dependent FMN reductase [Cohnella candidum]AYQ71561.1 NAD(P)H-dependent oxidoreductase [Cohnella candidum]